MSKVIIRKKTNALYRLFAMCPGGLEEVLKTELKELGLVHTKGAYAGGMEFEGDLTAAYTACLSLRTASRVLLLLEETKKVSHPDELYQAIRKLDWYRVFPPDCTFAVYLTETHTKERKGGINPQYLSLKAKDAIADHFTQRFGSRPNVDRKDPDITVRLHLHDDLLKIYLDLSGKSLHQRGYRSETLEAPLKENLAAGLLYLAGWNQRLKEKLAFYDPFCGSGTLLIEAAMMATRTPPGINRQSFGFYSWRDHQPKLFEKIHADLKSKIITDPANLPLIMGSDRDGSAIQVATQNISNANLSQVVKLKIGAFEKSTAFSPKGLIVTNPPYGVRIGESEILTQLYRSIGSTFKHQYQNWNAGVISSEKKFLQAISLKPSKKFSLHNGGLESLFYLYDLY